MSTAGRLAAFAALLLGVFGIAALAGGAIGPDRQSGGGSERAATESSMAGHGEGEGEERVAAPAGSAVPGLAVSDGGRRLALESGSFPRGRAATLHFRVDDARGDAVRDFDVEHEKRMHLIVVRRDGRGFQHLHPAMAPDGTWSVPLRLDEAGSYRVFADFAIDGRKQTLGSDLAVDGEADYGAFPAPATVADAGDGYRVSLASDGARAGREGDLRFTVTKDGRPVETEPYLGAGGHLVALRAGDLAYLHTHPAEHGEGDAVSFMTTFPSDGRYRLYFQFKHDGRVHTAEFTTEVAR